MKNVGTSPSVSDLTLVSMFFKVIPASLYFRAIFQASSFILIDFMIGVEVIPLSARIMIAIHPLPQ